VIFPADQDEIRNLINQSILSLDEINDELQILTNIAGIVIPINKIELNETIENAGFISNSETIESEVLNNSEWDTNSQYAHQLIQELDYYRSKTDKFDLLILDQDL